MLTKTNEPVESFKLDEGINEYGIHTQVSFEGDSVIKRQSYDANPILEACRAERIATEGQRWGEMRKVATIPMAEYAKLLTCKDNAERRKMIREFVQKNPHFCTFDKYLK